MTATGLSTPGTAITPAMFLQLTTESLPGPAASRCSPHRNAIVSAAACFIPICPFGNRLRGKFLAHESQIREWRAANRDGKVLLWSHFGDGGYRAGRNMKTAGWRNQKQQ